MTPYTEEINNKLNGLLVRTKDAEKGFKTAAENTNHTYLKHYFERKSKERHQFEYELNHEIRSFGAPTKTTGSIAGVAHRTWMDIKSLFSVDSDESMLEEAITGEKAALEEYNDVLSEISLPITTHSLLLKQKDTIECDFNRIKRLEDLH